MDEFKTKIGELVDARSVSTFVGLAGLTMLVPFFIHWQWLTGPFVNAMLIIILFILGIRSALVMCLVPSLMALASGLLPAVLAPAIPFIMISNVLYILIIDWIYNNFKDNTYGYWWGVFAGSTVKFLFLLVCVNIVGKLLIKNELILKVTQMFSWPQFATAVVGGMIAWVVLKWLKRI
jgi:riboflavin transporter